MSSSRSVESQRVDWSRERQCVRDDFSAIVRGVFACSGELLEANAGMRHLLDAFRTELAPSECLVNPAFHQVVQSFGPKGLVFEGLATFGNRCDPGVSLQCRIYRKGCELLVVGQYDVEELTQLNSELARTNREVNNLQREIVREKRRLEESNKRLQVFNEQKNRLLGIAAHDLRTPLGVIESLAEALSPSEAIPPEEHETLLEMILRNCRKMRGLLTDLLDITKIEQRRLEVHSRAVNPREFITTIAQRQGAELPRWECGEPKKRSGRCD